MFTLDEVRGVLNEIHDDNENAEYKGNTKPEFTPEYLVVHNDRDKAINAIIEIRALWDYAIKEAAYNYANMYSKLTIPISDALEQECQRHKEHFAVYDKTTKKWLIKASEPHYEYCYDGEDFAEFEIAKSDWKGNRLLLVGKYTILMQEANLLEETRTASAWFGNFALPNLKLIVGVPGCGKTTHIIQNHRTGSLVLTSCAEAAEDVRARVARLKHRPDPDRLRDSYRTIDSYLLHSRGKYKIVWVDEALMEHPGKLFLVSLYSKCRTIYMLGDPNQLGNIIRAGVSKLLYDKPSTYFAATKTLNISYRCPADVMAVLSPKYDGRVYSASDVTRSMTCERFTGLECVPKSKKIKYLVFKQAEKQLMKRAKYNVSTIHEFQGKEAEHVIVVRMSRNIDEALYKSAAHIVVGISRHTTSLVYYTPVADDMKKLIETPLTHVELKNVKKTG